MSVRSRLCLYQTGLALAWIAVYAEGEQTPYSQRLEQSASKYSIQFVLANEPFPIKLSSGAINGQTATRQELESYVPLLLFEFNLYPPELVKNAKLKRVVFCKGLSFAGQTRNAVPDFEHDTLYLDVARGRYSEQYMRKVIHHEFFHIVDYRDDGSLYKDDNWATLNPQGFSYGSGGRNAQNDPTVSLLDDSTPGFLNKYSTAGVEEDKAEVFANMMVNIAQLDERAQRDRILTLKMQRMADLLEKFTSAMDKNFWIQIHKLNRSTAQPKQKVPS